MGTIARFFARLRQALTPLPLARDDDPQYRSLIEAADREAEAELDAAGIPRQIGWTETFYDAKRDILRKKYGLRWKRPRE